MAVRVRSKSCRPIKAGMIAATALVLIGVGSATPAAAGGPGKRTRGLMHFIGALEAPGGYDDYYRGASAAPPEPLTSMSVNDVLAWQRRIAHSSKSTAAGRYQIIHATLRKLVGELNLTGTETFDKALQDRMAWQLMLDAGWSPDAEPSAELGTALAHVWAALPIMSGPQAGRSVYQGIAGNKALTTPAIFARVLAKASDPSAVNAAIRASGKSDIVRVPPATSHQILVATAVDDSDSGSMTSIDHPSAFGASVIEGGRLAPSRVIKFARDPFEVN